MPYPMAHLCIAYNLMKSCEIKNHSDFILGNLAPDSVHHQIDYKPDLKKKSHIANFNEEWGSIFQNEQWEENVFTFYENHKRHANSSFLLGYCAHIFADIKNNKKIWMPFKQANQDLEKNNIGQQYIKENLAIDYGLLFK